MAGLGISFSNKFLLQLLSPDGNLRVLAHDGVNSVIPSVFSHTPTTLLYGTPALNQWARNGAGTVVNQKRLIGLSHNQNNLNFTTFQKDIRTFKSGVILTYPWDLDTAADPSTLQQGQVPPIPTTSASPPLPSTSTGPEMIRFTHPTFNSLFSTPPDCSLDLDNVSDEMTMYKADPTQLKLPNHISMEVSLALFLATIHTTWAAQYPLLKPLQLLTFNCTDAVNFGQSNQPGMETMPLNKAVISIPPWFSTSQRISLIHSFKLAQLPLVDLVHDYFATLHTYTLSRMHTEEKYIIFFDFGHTETTLALAHLDPTKLTAQIIDYESHVSLGVRDCVDLVLKKIKTKFATLCKQHNVNVEDYFAQNNQKNLITWWNLVHKGIEKLTSSPQHTFEFPCTIGDCDDFSIPYSRDQFDQDLTPLFNQHMLKLLTTILTRNIDTLSAAHSKRQLSIEYTGAGCRIPIFQRLLSDFTCIVGSATLSNIPITATVNPDEAPGRGCAFITSSKYGVAGAQSGVKLPTNNEYCFTSHPQQWTFSDKTLRTHHNFPHLTTLYDKLEVNPQFNHQRYIDTHQYNILRQSYLQLNAFLAQCNKFETLLYECEEQASENDAKKEIYDYCLEWVTDTKQGDYHQVDVLMNYFNNVLASNGDAESIKKCKEKYHQDLKSLNEMLINTIIGENVSNQELYLNQMSKFSAAVGVWESIGGEESPQVLKWIGTDFYQQMTSAATPRLPVQHTSGVPQSVVNVVSIPTTTQTSPVPASSILTPIPTTTTTTTTTTTPITAPNTSKSTLTPSQMTPQSSVQAKALQIQTQQPQQQHQQHQQLQQRPPSAAHQTPTQSPNPADLHDLYASSFILGGPLVGSHPTTADSPANRPNHSHTPSPSSQLKPSTLAPVPSQTQHQPHVASPQPTAVKSTTNRIIADADDFDDYPAEQPISQPYSIPQSNQVHSIAPSPIVTPNATSKPQTQQQPQQQAHLAETHPHGAPPLYEESTGTISASNQGKHNGFVLVHPPIAHQASHDSQSTSTANSTHPSISPQHHTDEEQQNANTWFGVFQNWMKQHPDHSPSVSQSQPSQQSLGHSQSGSANHPKGPTVCVTFQNTGDCQAWTDKQCPYSHDLCDADFFGTCADGVKCTKVHLTPQAKKAIRGGK